MRTYFERGLLLRLLIAGLGLCGSRAWGQADPGPGAAPATDGWRWRPSLFVLGVYERDQGLSVPGAPGPAASTSDLQPALALGLEATRSGSRGGFQAEASLLGRDPLDGDARGVLFDGRAHAFRTLGSRWRVELDEALRVERREALPSGDFQRQQARATLEYRGLRGPAFRLQLADRRLGLPNARALDVTQRSLALGVVTRPRAGTSLEAKALFRRFGESAGQRSQLGAAFEATRVQAHGLVALHYHFSAAPGRRPAPAEALIGPALPSSLAARLGGVADFSAQSSPQPPTAGAAQASLDELPEVPLADALDDEGESWPARREHLLSLYGSRLFGRLRLALRAQLRWRSEREPLSATLPPFDDRRWHLRATLRWRLNRHGALIAQAARASESGNPAAPELVRSQVFLGLQLR